MPLISIIIPVYNVKPYLRQCLDSILAQDEQSWEAIVVDDGSTDGSSEICDEYASKDSRFRVFHKENGGVSSARNLALKYINGEWIAFIDSDDEITPDYLSIPEAYKDCDVIQKGYDVIRSNGDIISSHNISSDNLLDKKALIYSFYVNNRNNALWDKIISKKIIGQQEFNENVKIGEDFLFFLSILPRIKKYSFSGKGKYLYRRLPTSAMASINKDIPARLKVIEENIENIKECNKIISNCPLIYSIIYKGYFPYYYFYHRQITSTQRKQYRALVSEFTFNRIKYIDTGSKFKTVCKILISLFFRYDK